ncbi:hypothetical protein V6N13_101144 [Hibiscus sabdariffa]
MEGFKKHCTPVLSLDGCYLKWGFKGEILAAVGRDGNNQIFTMAWVVIEVENRETWVWFLKHILTNLEIGDGDRFTILSDMQKGLLEEIQMILPNFEHRFCARHMYANWKKEHNGHDMQQVFWECCKATTEAEFHKQFARMATMMDIALSSLLKRDPKHWSKAFFETHFKCDVVDNNFGKAYNSTFISGIYKSIISLFEDIRHYVMDRNLAHKHKCQKWESLLCPKIAKLVENHRASSAYCHVTWNGQNGFEPDKPSQMMVMRPNTRSQVKSVTMFEPLTPSQSAPLSQQSESTHLALVNQTAVMSTTPSTSSLFDSACCFSKFTSLSEWANSWPASLSHMTLETKKHDRTSSYQQEYKKYHFSPIYLNDPSEIVNESPTKFFSIRPGLRQGCPLSPLVFNIVGEALSTLLCKAVSLGFFNGSVIRNSRVEDSHLQFVDGSKIQFWLDCYAGYSPLKSTCPRIYVIAIEKSGVVVEFGSFEEDGWHWNIQL